MSAEKSTLPEDTSSQGSRSVASEQYPLQKPSVDLSAHTRVDDPSQVTWTGPDDPENPKNFTGLRKWIVVTLVSLYALSVAYADSSAAPAITQIGEGLGIPSSLERALVYSIFGFGFVVGTPPTGPLSELYGRVKVLHISFFVFMVFDMACGLATTKTQFYVFRLLTGIGGSAPIVIGAGVVSDCFRPEKLGRGSAFYGLAPRLGPALAPVVSGWIVQYTRWNWVFWAPSIGNGVLFILGIIFVEETRPAIRLKWKAQRLSRASGVEELHTADWPQEESDARRLWTGLVRPFKFLATHLILQYLAIYQTYITGILYLVLSTYSLLWLNEYHETPGIAGLNYLSLALGLILGNRICSYFNDWTYDYFRHRRHRAAAKRATEDGSPVPDASSFGRPEDRVPLMLLGAVCLPAGILLYGWTAEFHVFWLVPNIGVFLVGLGIIIGSQGVKLFTIDTYGTYAASATGGVNFCRAIGTAVFPLFAPKMLQTLGYGWTNTVLAGIAVLLGIPGPIMLYTLGPRMRKRAKSLTEGEADR